MIAACRGILVDDDLRAVVLQPIVHLPRRLLMTCPHEGGHLCLDADRIGSDPLSEADHPGLVEEIVIETRSDVDSHRPDLLVLGVPILIDLWFRVAMRELLRRPAS